MKKPIAGTGQVFNNILNNHHIEALKHCTVGLIGDGMKTVNADRIFNRYQDECNRVGMYAKAWPAFVDLVRSQNWLSIGQGSNNDFVITFTTKEI